MFKSLINNEIEFYLLLFLLVVSIYLQNKYLIIFLLGIIIFLTFFYRVPEYNFSGDSNNLVCPCKGKIIKVEDTETHTKLYIFLSAFDPHIQIMPYSGKLVKYEFIPGKFQFAYKLEKDNYRTRFITHISSNHGLIELIQNTGMITRRIKNNHQINKKVEKGEILGIIKFGSRVDISIPKSFKITCKINDYVNLGDTIAQLKN